MKKKKSFVKDWDRSDYRIVIGHHAILEVLKTRPKEVAYAWFREGMESSQDLRLLSEDCRRYGIKIEIKSETQLDRLASSHQGSAFFLKETPEFDWDELLKKEKAIVLFLDGIEDPHNLGAIIRTSWLMGVSGLVIPAERSVGLTPSVHKVACGGVEHVPVEIANQFTNRISDLKNNGFWVYGLAHDSRKIIFDLNFPDKVVWMIGAEDKGLRVTSKKLCDDLVGIPQLDDSASYNASVATGIALSETYRQIYFQKN